MAVNRNHQLTRPGWTDFIVYVRRSRRVPHRKSYKNVCNVCSPVMRDVTILHTLKHHSKINYCFKEEINSNIEGK